MNDSGTSQKIVQKNTKAIITSSLKEPQYVGNQFQFFPHAEGYVRNTPAKNINQYSYVYHYTDHLGNIRLSYTKNTATGVPEILEENHYYPFGLKHSGYNSNNGQPKYKYKYNGKELQEELGLNVYDYGARNYDPAIGRWFTIDPLAEKYLSITPYAYVAGNPLRFIDPNGMEIKKVDGGYNYTEQDAVDVFNLLKASMDNKSEKRKGSIGIITFGQEKIWGEAMKFAVPEAIMSNVPASSGRGGIQDFYNSIKEISDQSPDGIGFLGIFSHGGVDRNSNRSTFGEGMIFANASLNPSANNVYTSDLYNIGIAVDKGYLNFAPYSTVYLGACNSSTVYKSANFPSGQSFAMEFARATRNSFVYGAANEHMNASNPNNPKNTSFYPERGGTLMINYWPYWSPTGSSVPALNQVVDVVKLAEIYR